MDALLTSLAEILRQSTWLAPLVAFMAGVLTSFTPCSLSSVPLIVGYVGGSSLQQNSGKGTQRALGLSITFAIGSAVTFTLFGVMASLAGELIGTVSPWWYIALGTLMMLMTLQMLGIYEIIPSSHLLSKNSKKGYVGAFVAGILGGIFSSPCSTPVLIALIAVVAGQGDLAFGVLLFLLYSLGHGILAVVAGTSVGLVQKLSTDSKYARLSSMLTKILALAIMAMGFYMFHLAFQL